MSEPISFDLRLPPLALCHGGTVEPHHARGFFWGPPEDLPVLRARTWILERRRAPLPEQVRRKEALPVKDLSSAPRLSAQIPTVLLLHGLSGDARVGGEGGWWEPLIGSGKVLDPSKLRILCFNNLGSCYGSSGPQDVGFPAAALSTLTAWDTARAQLLALDALGLDSLALVAGGSIGGMASLCLAALAPKRVKRLLPMVVSAASSAWVVGFNHVARQALQLDPEGRGLELARQLAMLTYRSEPSLEQRQGRHLRVQEGSCYRIQSYLEHQGQKLLQRFDPLSYLAQLSVMDHHDLFSPPPGEEGLPGLSRIRASTLALDVDSDQLFTPAQVDALAENLSAAGAHVERATLHSPHGHDAFLMEWEQLAPIVARALALPEPK